MEDKYENTHETFNMVPDTQCFTQEMFHSLTCPSFPSPSDHLT